MNKSKCGDLIGSSADNWENNISLGSLKIIFLFYLHETLKKEKKKKCKILFWFRWTLLWMLKSDLLLKNGRGVYFLALYWLMSFLLSKFSLTNHR